MCRRRSPIGSTALQDLLSRPKRIDSRNSSVRRSAWAIGLAWPRGTLYFRKVIPVRHWRFTVPLVALVLTACSDGTSVARPAPTPPLSRVPTPTSPPAGPPAASVNTSPEVTAGVADEQTFLALGDSYTIGEGVPASERWPVQLVQRLRDDGVAIAEPQLVARTGWTTRNLSVAMNEVERSGPYSLVTLLIGVNNQYRGLAVEDYLAEFEALLQRSVVLGGGEPSNVIVVSIPDWSVTPFAAGRDRSEIAAEIDIFNAINREIATRFGVRYVDITPISREAETDLKLLANDRLHPSGKMYGLWVELILPEAREVLQAP